RLRGHGPRAGVGPRRAARRGWRPGPDAGGMAAVGRADPRLQGARRAPGRDLARRGAAGDLEPEPRRGLLGDRGGRLVALHDVPAGPGGPGNDRGETPRRRRPGGADGEVVAALDAATGRTLWEHVYEAPPVSGMNLQEGAGPHATPLVVGGLVYAVGATGKLHALDEKTGRVVWSHDLWQELGGK